MNKLKYKEITKIPKSERENKIQELKLELMKSKTASSKSGGSSKSKEIKKMIARILTIKEGKK
ncbi:MAG: 50S ribosomal protein L29 [Candidatus Pacearchaeota archaeon]|jgi:ribosomal protein L29